MSEELKLGASAVDNALAANPRLGVWIPRSPVRTQDVCWMTAIPVLRSQAGCRDELEYMNFRTRERSCYLKQNIENGGVETQCQRGTRTHSGVTHTYTHAFKYASHVLSSCHTCTQSQLEMFVKGQNTMLHPMCFSSVYCSVHVN